MKKHNVLVLTDHTNHSKENSLYDLVGTMLRHSLTNSIDIASRGNKDNKDFFEKLDSSRLLVSQVDEHFAYTENGNYLSSNLRAAKLATYDLIWLRMPPPLDKSFLDFMDVVFQNQCVINNPKGIYETGSKEFLINFHSLTPPTKICRTKLDIIDFKNQFPIVLKPFREYGGRGIVKIDGNDVWIGKDQLTFKNFMEQLPSEGLQYIGVQYLKNVSQGDKRIIVVNGQVLGASLRLPAKGSWLCNVAMGGTSNLTDVAEEEYTMIAELNPILSKLGIVMYGVDTLVGNDGKRVLSEINTTSIGGLPQIARLRKLPLVEEAIDLIWSYFTNKKQNEH